MCNPVGIYIAWSENWKPFSASAFMLQTCWLFEAGPQQLEKGNSACLWVERGSEELALTGLSFFKAIISIALLVKMLGNSSDQRTNMNLIKTRTKADLLFFLSIISLSSLQRSCMDYVTGCRVCCAREVVKPNIDMPLKSKHSKQKGWNGRCGDVQGEEKSQEINYRGSSRVYR